MLADIKQREPKDRTRINVHDELNRPGFPGGFRV